MLHPVPGISTGFAGVTSLLSSPVVYNTLAWCSFCITPVICRLWAGETGQSWSACRPQKYPGESGNAWLHPREERWCVLPIAQWFNGVIILHVCQSLLAMFQVVVSQPLAVLVVTLQTLPWVQGECRPQWGLSSPVTSTRYDFSCVLPSHRYMLLHEWECNIFYVARGTNANWAVITVRLIHSDKIFKMARNYMLY